MTHDDFVKKYAAKYLEFPGTGSALYQCIDLMRFYIRDVWALDPYILPRALYAKDVFNNFKSTTKLLKILNTPTGIPQKGDLIFFKTSLWYPWLYGRAGHVAIYDNGDLYNIISFDQNYPTYTACHLQRHSYKDCLGWVRKR